MNGLSAEIMTALVKQENLDEIFRHEEEQETKLINGEHKTLRK